MRFLKNTPTTATINPRISAVSVSRARSSPRGSTRCPATLVTPPLFCANSNETGMSHAATDHTPSGSLGCRSRTLLPTPRGGGVNTSASSTVSTIPAYPSISLNTSHTRCADASTSTDFSNRIPNLLGREPRTPECTDCTAPPLPTRRSAHLVVPARRSPPTPRGRRAGAVEFASSSMVGWARARMRTVQSGPHAEGMPEPMGAHSPAIGRSVDLARIALAKLARAA
ncbi:hypothetical protein DFR74_102396 [Nocardia puris]|uniref:Uncharacterized protein n=1 Tax=Nocardia puris TaxID=208602 RepID=A0A366DV58_9NOCA|nr:hypothetical protein DFR74_102396 [Nocardia puris]